MYTVSYEITEYVQPVPDPPAPVPVPVAVGDEDWYSVDVRFIVRDLYWGEETANDRIYSKLKVDNGNIFSETFVCDGMAAE